MKTRAMHPLVSRPGARWTVAAAAACLLAAAVPSAPAQSVVQSYYVPVPEQQVRQAFLVLAGNTGTTIDSVVSMVMGVNGTRVVYDHWEDGYEIDLDHPAQASTQVWGDGIDANGKPPGFASDPAALNAGDVIALRNLVTLPRNPSTVLYDARDRVGATKGIVMSRAAWAVQPGSVLADAVEVTATLDWGVSYVAPVGQDVVFPSPAYASMFERVWLLVMAAEDETAVQIDTDADGSADVAVTLGPGESHMVNGGILKGATVQASKPVQVHLLTGDIGANYESRWFTLAPADQWSGDYYAPVGTAADGDDTYILLHNAAAQPVTIHYTTRTGSGSFDVPPRDTYRFLMPQSSAARFRSDGGEPFFAVGAVGAEPSANNVHDWGYSLVPVQNLTTLAVVGWGPGSSDLSRNGSPVWVTATDATRIYVDYDGDRSGPLTDPAGEEYDEHFDVAALEIRRLYDGDRDQTGLRVYTLDGTLITAAWGQDPAVAGPGNPYLDMGTTVPAFPVPVFVKDCSIAVDSGLPGLSIGDTLEYRITLDNSSLVALGNLLVLDGLPPQLAYVADSTVRDGVPIGDDAAPASAFPLDEEGILIPLLLRGQSTTVRYRTVILAGGDITNTAQSSLPGVGDTHDIVVPPPAGSHPCVVDFTDAAGVPVGVYSANAPVYLRLSDIDAGTDALAIETVEVIVTDLVTGDVETVLLAETGPDTHVFASGSPLASSTTLGLAPGDGTLHALAGDGLVARYTDPLYGDTCSDTAVVAAPSEFKPLYLGDAGPGNILDRVDPVATGDTTTSTGAVLRTASALAVSNVSTGSVAEGSSALTSLSVDHVTAAGANRLMLVGIGIEDDGTASLDVSAVDYVVGTSTQGLTRVRRRASNQEAEGEIWRLTSPASGAGTVVVSLSDGRANDDDSVFAAVTTFTGVDLSSPLGTPATTKGSGTSASLAVSSDDGDLVFGVFALDDSRSATPGAGSTVLWNGYSEVANSDGIRSGGSTTPGGSGATISWTCNYDAWALLGVPVRPAPATGGASTVFTLAPALCEPLALPAGGLVEVVAHVEVTSGALPAHPSVTARVGVEGGYALTLTNAVYDSGAGTLAWSGVVPVSTHFPAGSAVQLEVASDEGGGAFRVLYDSLAHPSRVVLPTTTVIRVVDLALYDAAFPGGAPLTAAANGQTVFVRATVSDPFGASDITGLDLSADGPGIGGDLSLALDDAGVVAADACSKTYEYAWHTGAVEGNYTVSVTAHEGYEGDVTDSRSTPVALSPLDLGTPSTTEFTTGPNGPHTAVYATNETVCVRTTDLDQDTDPLAIDTVQVTLTTGTGDTETLTLAETGVDTGVFTNSLPASSTVAGSPGDGVLHAPASTALAVSYTDPDDPTDTSGDTATVPAAPGVPGISVSKSLLAPADGQAVAGDAVRFLLRVVNTGSTTQGTVQVTDTYPAAALAFDTAVPPPDAAGAGTLAWNNVGPLAPGAATNVVVDFTAAGPSPAATNRAVATAGAAVSTNTAAVAVTQPALVVAKTVLTPGPASFGELVLFRVAVTNTGSTAVAELPLEDTFSASGFEFVSATPEPDGQGSGSLLWLDLTGAGQLEPGAAATVDVTFRVVGGGDPASNRAAVDYALDVHGDPVPPAADTAGLVTLAASVSGRVCEDRANPGFGGDTPLAGVGVALFSDPNGDGDPADGALLRLQATGADGTYEFLHLGDGPYVVVETDPAGYTSVADTAGPNDNRIPVRVTVLTAYAGNDFLDTDRETASVGDTVWFDVDGDGLLDPGEPGLPNVAVVLHDEHLAPLATNVTGAGGTYLFAGLPAGAFTVDVLGGTLPAGLAAAPGTQDPLAVVLALGERFADADFGFTPPDTGAAWIGDLVWSDADGDGVRDPGEPGLGGVTLALVSSGAAVAATTTAADGTYHFADVAPGEYTVAVTDTDAVLAAYALTGGSDPSAPFTAAPGDVYLNADFGYRNASLHGITDRAWYDADGDGTADPGEPGIGGLTVNLLDAGGTVIATAASAADGTFSFHGLPDGDYSLAVSDTAGKLAATTPTTAPAAARRAPAAVAGADVSGTRFGYVRAGAVGDTVWSDADGDGLRSPGEPGLGGVAVVLWRDADSNGVFEASADTAVATHVTDAAGLYVFEGMAPGTYFVSLDAGQAALAGYAATVADEQAGAGAAGLQQNAAVPTVLSSDMEADFGFRNASLHDVSGSVWNDLDTDGADGGAGEPPIPGVTLALVDAGGATVAETASAADGSYAFRGVPDGSFAVKVTDRHGVLDGYRITTGLSTRPVTVAGADVGGIDFGYVRDGRTASIGDTAWYDTNGDGVRDANERGLPGTVVNLYGDTNGNGQYDAGADAQAAATVVLPDGSYVFAGLSAGVYFAGTAPANFAAGGVLEGMASTTGGDVTGAIPLSGGEAYREADFGYRGTGYAVGDFVWADADEDGIQDPDEAGRGGVVLDLVSNGTAVATTTTGAAGLYRFTGLGTGTYHVVVAASNFGAGGPLEGCTATVGPQSAGGLTSGGITFLDDADPANDSRANLDFGFHAPGMGRIGDLVWADTDGDGAVDAGEDGIPGVSLALLNAQGDAAAVVTTGPLGAYRFRGLAAGGYRVTVTDTGAVLGGLHLTAGTNPSAVVSLAAGEHRADLDFGYRGEAGLLGDLVFHDRDADGFRAPGEPGLQGVTLELWQDVDENGLLEPGTDNLVTSETTDARGGYFFGGLPAARYLVHVTDVGHVLDGFTKTLGIANADGFSKLDPYGLVLTGAAPDSLLADFGYAAAATPLSILGTVWEDLDGQGDRDALDPALPGVAVTLYRDLAGNGVWDAGDPSFGTATTDAGGDFAFVSLPPGHYLVAVSDTTGVLAMKRPTYGIPDTVDQGQVNPYPVTLVDADLDGADFCYTSERPTLVLVTRFEVTPADEGLAVEWETASEVGTVGFYVLRRGPGDADYEPVHPDILPAMLTSVQGGTYRLVDASARRDVPYRYVLREVEASGLTRHYGPYGEGAPRGPGAVPATARPAGRARSAARTPAAPDPAPRFEQRARPATLDRTASATAAARAEAELRAEAANPAVPTYRVRLRVTAGGLHRVDAADLAAALGLATPDVQGMLARQGFRLSHQGFEIPWIADTGGTGLFFHGEAIESLFTTENVYWLESGRGIKAATVGAGRAVPDDGTAWFVDRTHYEQDVFPANSLFYDADDDMWLWGYQYVTASAPGAPLRFAFTTRGRSAAGSDAEVTVYLQGAADTTANPDQHAVVRVNGTPVGEVSWNGAQPAVLTAAFSPALLADGTNTLEVAGVLDAGVPFTYFYVDSFDIAYPRRYVAEAGRLAFDAAGHASVTVRGFPTPDICLLDVTDPCEPRQVLQRRAAREGGTFSLSFAPSAGDRRYLAQTLATALAPASIEGVPLSALPAATNGFDYVVIAPASLTEAAEELAAYRRTQGLSALVVELQELYDHFNHGVADPEAIRHFITWAVRAWNVPARYVVLAGTGTYDYRNLRGSNENLVPPGMLATPLGLFASDLPLCDIDGDAVPEVALGRLPVMTPAELRAVLAKIQSYEAGGAWKQKVFMLADDPDDGGDFPATSDGLASLVTPGYATEKAYLPQLGLPATRGSALGAFGSGAGLFNYTGHSGMDRMASEAIVTTADVPGIQNGDRPPFVVAITCIIGRFGIPGYASLSEALAASPGGGAVAVWSPVSLSFNSQNALLDQELFREIFERGTARIGDAVTVALDYYARVGEMGFMSNVYNLLGDPATAFGNPVGLQPNPVLVPSPDLSFEEWLQLHFTPRQLDHPATKQWAEQFRGTVVSP